MSEPVLRAPRQGDEVADRVSGRLARDVKQALDGLLFARAQFLEVTRGQTFASTRRFYTTSGVLTRDVEVFSTGETIVPHGLGQAPQGRLVVGQNGSTVLFDLDVAKLDPPLDPKAYVAFRSSVTALFRVVVF